MAGRPREFDDEAVIQAAMEAFWRCGFEATSAQDLVESTGLGRGSLYSAFGNKAQIYHQALAYYHAASIEFHQAIFQQVGSVKQRLQTLLLKGIELDFSETERNGCMAIFSPLERAAQDKQIEQMSQHYVKKLESMFISLFNSGIETGEFSNVKSAECMAKSFICAYFGFRVFGRIVHEKSFQLQAIDALLNSFN